MQASKGTRGQFAYDGLDRTLHERARLGIMTSLMSHPKGIYFPQLKTLCDLTDGNLKRHLDVLCEEGLVAMVKAPVGNRTQTLYKILPKGKARFVSYLEELQRVLNDATKTLPGLASIPKTSKT